MNEPSQEEIDAATKWYQSLPRQKQVYLIDLKPWPGGYPTNFTVDAWKKQDTIFTDFKEIK